MSQKIIQTTNNDIDVVNIIESHINSYYYAGLKSEHRYLVLMGGAGSGKSVFACQKIIIRCLCNKHKFLVIRKVAKTLRHSCFTLIVQLIESFGLRKLIRINQSDLSITFLHNQSTIIFMGCDDSEKLKSITGITSIFIEEATELSIFDFEQIDLRMRGIGNGYKQIMVAFNPISEQHWLRQYFFLREQHGQTYIIKSTYKNNPFLDDAYIKKIELLQERNYNLYRIYGEGEWGTLEGVVYTNWQIIQESEWPDTFDDEIAGIDFGFNNPSVVVRIGIKDEYNIYLKELLYESGLTTRELVNKINMFRTIHDINIYADAAEPDRIEEIQQAGHSIYPADKSAGSVTAGIAYLQGCKIYTLPTNININSELQSYCWETNKDGIALDRPCKFNDHAMDAIRYAVYTHSKRGFSVMTI